MGWNSPYSAQGFDVGRIVGFEQLVQSSDQVAGGLSFQKPSPSIIQ